MWWFIIALRRPCMHKVSVSSQFLPASIPPAIPFACFNVSTDSLHPDRTRIYRVVRPYFWQISKRARSMGGLCTRTVRGPHLDGWTFRGHPDGCLLERHTLCCGLSFPTRFEPLATPWSHALLSACARSRSSPPDAGTGIWSHAMSRYGNRHFLTPPPTTSRGKSELPVSGSFSFVYTLNLRSTVARTPYSLVQREYGYEERAYGPGAEDDDETVRICSVVSP